MTEALNKITTKFYNKGKEDEKLVMKLLEEKCGGKCEEASRKEDIFKHIDIWWKSPKKGKLGIDVKGKHRARRNCSSFDDTIHWVEMQNVLGRKGWLYGDCNYFAFVTSSKVIFVKQKALQAFIEGKIKGKTVVTSTPSDCYVPYTRSKWGRNDISCKALNSDLESIAHFVLEYEEEKK